MVKVFLIIHLKSTKFYNDLNDLFHEDFSCISVTDLSSCQRENEREMIPKKTWVGSNVATATLSCLKGNIMNKNVNFLIQGSSSRDGKCVHVVAQATSLVLFCLL